LVVFLLFFYKNQETDKIKKPVTLQQGPKQQQQHKMGIIPELYGSMLDITNQLSASSHFTNNNNKKPVF